MKNTKITVMLLYLFGTILLVGCDKKSTVNVPVSFTDKDGNVYIQIDTARNSFDAYSGNKVGTGKLNGVFNDTVRSSFYLAITSDPYWDTVFHPRDTLVFPTHYTGHTLTIRTDVDLKAFNSPYHFLLLGLPPYSLKSGKHGRPSIMVTVNPGE